jgi:hypothetical protein
MMPLGIGMAPRDRSDIPTMNRSKRHHQSATNRPHRLAAMFTASSAAKTAMKTWSRESKKEERGVGLPSLSVRLVLSWAWAMPQAKFCGLHDEKQDSGENGLVREIQTV